MAYSNIAKHNGETYDLRTNYHSKVTEVFHESSEYFIIVYSKMNKLHLVNKVVSSIIFIFY